MYSPETITFVNAMLNVPLSFVAIFGNTLVVKAILSSPAIYAQPASVILCSLAVSDLLVGLIIQPIYIAKELTGEALLQEIWNTLGYTVCGVSLSLITAKSVDRLMAIQFHMRYSTLVTRSRVKFTIALIWLINLAATGVYFFDSFLYDILSAILTGMCLIISTFAYISIYRIVRRHHFRIQSQRQAVDFTRRTNLRTSQIIKSALNTFVFQVCMVACYFPMSIILMIYGLSPSYGIWRREWSLAVTLLLINSSINPFLYYWRLRDLRLAIKDVFEAIFGRRD